MTVEDEKAVGEDCATLRTALDEIATSVNRLEAERDAARAQVATLREALALLLEQSGGLGDRQRRALDALRDTTATAEAFVARIRGEEPPAERVEPIVRNEMRAWFIVEILGGALIEGAKCDATTVRSALAEHDAKVAAEARRAAFASVALEIRASIACAKRDGETWDPDWLEAVAETVEGYAEGDGEPDDKRNRQLLAEPRPEVKPDETSARIQAALDKSRPLVAEALKIGRSIAGTDQSLAGVVIGSSPLTLNHQPSTTASGEQPEAPAQRATCGVCKGDGRTLAGNSVWPCTNCGGTGRAGKATP